MSVVYKYMTSVNTVVSYASVPADITRQLMILVELGPC